VTNGVYPAWCLQKPVPINIGQLYQATLYSSIGPAIPPPFNSYPFDKINWILNHKGTASINDVQAAIWYFNGYFPVPPTPGSQALVDDANAHGVGYVPSPGDIVAVIVFISPTIQSTIIEVRWECDSQVCPFNLPPVQVQVGVTPFSFGQFSAWTDYLSSVPAGYEVTNGAYPAWCIQPKVPIFAGHLYQATLYSSISPGIPPPINGYAWDKINWILNHRGTASIKDVQSAIWFFTGQLVGTPTPGAQALINDANANGVGYVPGPGDIVAVIVYISPTIQSSIIVVRWLCL
jgi:hypothetical protein